MAQLESRFHLVVVGDGPSRAGLLNCAHEQGIGDRVHFVGEVISHHNLHQYLDASVLCSLNEGFPNSVIEAMAAAKPVLATPVGGVTDAVTHGVSGIFVPADDPAPLADALRALQADPMLRTRIGEAGRKAVRQKFSQEVVVEKLMTLYETLAHRVPASGLRRADA
jgi:glycosyltransferase involved in cell wall biosynthesis